METLPEKLSQYLEETLQIRTQLFPWKEQVQLPVFLKEHYNFYEATLLDHPCLFMIAKSDVEITPAQVKKHWEQVQKKWNNPSIFVQEAISGYSRQQLIKYQVPFIIPNNQMYVPELGINLSEHFRETRKKKQPLSPATQRVLIYALLGGSENEFTPVRLAKKLGYSRMTLTRVFNYLRQLGIGEINRKGKQYWWTFSETKRELWKKVEPLLRNPIIKRVWLKGKEPPSLAGLSALSQYSMLNPPKLPTYAVAIHDWTWGNSAVKRVEGPEDAAFELELWSYNPDLFAKDGIVDPFSLYLSLRETQDERVEAALEQMMRRIKW